VFQRRNNLPFYIYTPLLMFSLVAKSSLCRVNRCLAKFGVYPSPTYGTDGRLRFHSDNPVQLLDGDKRLAKFYYFSWENVAIGNAQVLLQIMLHQP